MDLFWRNLMHINIVIEAEIVVKNIQHLVMFYSLS